MKIGVYGSALGGINDQLVAAARNLGTVIASRRHTIVMGACPGLPYEAVLGAQEYSHGQTRVIGYSPGVDLQDHQQRFNFPADGITKFKFLPEEYKTREKAVCLKLRNVFSVEACDAAIFVSGRIGTMNEFTIAYDVGRNIGLLCGTGGFTDRARELVDALGKPSESIIVERSSPLQLVAELERFHREKQVQDQIKNL